MLSKRQNNIVSLKRISAAVCILAIAMSLMLPAFADDEGISKVPEVEKCTSAYLYNFENDFVLYKLNENGKVFPASTTKIMTAIVCFEQFGDDLDRGVTITEEMLTDCVGNLIGFTAGEVVTVRQLLYCMLVNSANDAAVALAYATAGGIEEFAELMNVKAARLGCTNTNYTNPTGMHDSAMYTTAQDTAKVAKYAYSIPELVEMTSTPKYVMDATNQSDYRNIYNRNALVSKYYNSYYYYSGVVGLNAGATSQGGYAVVAIAEDAESGLTYLAVVLGAEEDSDEIYSYYNAVNMFDWAFEAYTYTKVLDRNKVVCEVPVSLSSTIDYVTLVPETELTVYLPSDVDLSEEIRYSYNTYEDSIDAPVESGIAAGTITVFYGEEILGSSRLITTSSVTRSEFLYFLSRVEEFTSSRFFRGTIISFVIISIFTVIHNARVREEQIRRRSRYSSYRKR